MNPFPEVFSKGAPSLKSRIAQMRYLNNFTYKEQFPEQKEAQTSPNLTRAIGFIIPRPSHRPPDSGIKRPVIKIPSPPLLNAGLLTKVAYNTPAETRKNTYTGRSEKNTGKVVILKSRSPSPVYVKTAEMKRKRSTKRPESTPLGLNSTSNAAVVASFRQHTSLPRSRKALNLSLPSRLLSSLLQPFSEFVLGSSEVDMKGKTIQTIAPILGHVLEDQEKKAKLTEMVEELYGVKEEKVEKIAAFHHCGSKDYYVVLLGRRVPLSVCCNCIILAQVSVGSEGQLLCTGSFCSQRILHKFGVSEEIHRLLWGTGEEDQTAVSKAISRQIQTGSYRSRSLRTEARKNDVSIRRQWHASVFLPRTPRTFLSRHRAYHRSSVSPSVPSSP